MWKIKDGNLLLTQDNELKIVDLLDDRNVPIVKTIPIANQYQEELCKIATFQTDNLSEEAVQAIEQAGYIQKIENSPEYDPIFKQRLHQFSQPFLWMLNDEAKELYEYSLSLHAARKHFSADFIQWPCLPETSTRRALTLQKKHKNGKILLLGDDDLVSPLLAKLGVNVTVLDVDRYLLDFLKHICHRDNLEITTLYQDIKNPLSSDLQNSFDAVLTDPVSVENWFALFLSRAVGAIKKEGLIYLVAYDRKEGLLRYLANKMGLIESYQWGGFNHYYSYDGIYNPSWQSNLFVLSQSSTTQIIVPHDRLFEEDLGEFPDRPDEEYTFDFYQCHPSYSWDECFQRLSAELLQRFPAKTVKILNFSQEDRFCIYLATDSMTIQILAYPSQKYVGLTAFASEETLRFISLVNDIFIVLFQPSEYKENFLLRFIEHP